VRITVSRPTGIIMPRYPCKIRAATICGTFMASPQNTDGNA